MNRHKFSTSHFMAEEAAHFLRILFQEKDPRLGIFTALIWTAARVVISFCCWKVLGSLPVVCKLSSHSLICMNYLVLKGQPANLTLSLNSLNFNENFQHSIKQNSSSHFLSHTSIFFLHFVPNHSEKVCWQSAQMGWKSEWCRKWKKRTRSWFRPTRSSPERKSERWSRTTRWKTLKREDNLKLRERESES